MLESLLSSSAAQLLIALTNLTGYAQKWCMVIAPQGQNQAKRLTGLHKRQSAGDGHLAAR